MGEGGKPELIQAFFFLQNNSVILIQLVLFLKTKEPIW